MFDIELRRLVDPALEQAGAALARRGVSADAVTVAGFVAGLGCVPAIALEAWWAAIVCLALNRLADGLDGAIARRVGPTDFGGYLDIVCDFIFYAAFAFAFAFADPAYAVPAAALVLSFVGTGSSFLAFAIIAAKRGIAGDGPASKSFLYSRGVAEGGETLAFFVLCLLWPAAFPWLAYGFAALCWLTTALRVALAWRTFGGR